MLINAPVAVSGQGRRAGKEVIMERKYIHFEDKRYL